MADIAQFIKMKYEDLLIGISPIIDGWPMMKTPVPIVSILVFYLYFVLKLGPRLMENRKPFEMRPILVAYNGYQVLFSFWLCTQAFNVDNTIKNVFSFGCAIAPSLNEKLALALWESAWWYFFSKIIDLLDTVFFVLRKKQDQITFLHVYHHFITCLFSWGYLKYLPGEQGALLGFLNSSVHVVMYFYYMVAAMGPAYQKYIWWKKYMTWIQLLQFSIMLIYLTLIIALDCQVSRSLTIFFVVNVIIFLVLFANFYVKAYKKGNTAKKSIENNNDQNNNNNSKIIKTMKILSDKEKLQNIYVNDIKKFT